ncbi:MAG: peptide chain release factor N(5)-glutamine methyltransferase [Oligoflexia bacterium]|nr:peptide chain release factor N(5)-glutamine methyltransferase [Oligoflexia bacterium]
MTLKEALIKGAEVLRTYSESPRLDADILMSFMLGVPKIKLFSEWHRVLSADEQAKFFDFIERRRKHEPVAYITGTKEFFARDFVVSPSVLVPRPDTELLVEKALELAANMQQPRIVDLGTGSGCIIVSVIACLRAKGVTASGVAVDVSAAALAVAKENASRHDCLEMIEFVQGSWLDGVHGPSDLILSNPPYIAESDRRISKELNFEPRQALFSGPTGLECVLHLLESVPDYLKPGGAFLCETGAGQHQDIERALSARHRPGYHSEYFRDLAGNERLVALFKEPLK